MTRSALVGVAPVDDRHPNRTEHLLPSGMNTATALTGGYEFAFALGAALVVAAGVLLGAVVLRSGGM